MKLEGVLRINRKIATALLLSLFLLSQHIREKEPNNCFASAFPISINSVLRGQLDQEDGQDFFLIKIKERGVYDFTVEAEGKERIGLVIFSEKELLRADPLYQISKEEDDCVQKKIPVAAAEGKGRIVAAGVEMAPGNYYIKICAVAPFEKAGLKFPLLLRLLSFYEPEEKLAYTLKISPGTRPRDYLFLLEEVWSWIEQTAEGAIASNRINYLKSRYAEILKSGNLTEREMHRSLPKFDWDKMPSPAIKAFIEIKGRLLKSLASSPTVISHIRESMSFSHKLTGQERSHLSKLWQEQKTESYPFNSIFPYSSFLYKSKRLMKALFLCVYDKNGILSLATDSGCPFLAEELNYWNELRNFKGFYWRKPCFNKKLGYWTSVIASQVNDPVYKHKIGIIVAEVVIGR